MTFRSETVICDPPRLALPGGEDKAVSPHLLARQDSHECRDHRVTQTCASYAFRVQVFLFSFCLRMNGRLFITDFLYVKLFWNFVFSRWNASYAQKKKKK